MFLIVDAQALQDPVTRTRGIGRQLGNLLRELRRVRPEWRIEAVFNAALPAADQDAVPATVDRLLLHPLLPMTEPAREANERYFGDCLSARGPDVVLETNFFEGVSLVPCFPASRPRLAGVVHDLIPLLFHRHYLASPDRREHYGSRLRRFAQVDVALAVSEATRRDVQRLLGWLDDRIVAIGGAADGGTVPPPPESGATQLILGSLGIDAPFVLYVGGADRRKNVEGALAAFAALPAEVRAEYLLVIVCDLPRHRQRELRAAAARLGIEPRVRLTGFASDVTLGALYGSCRLTLFPSFYEGLGLPLLESLANGAPVVASDRSAIPEFSGAVARLADPASPQAMADAMVATLDEPYEEGAARRRAFANGFTWQATAGVAADAIERSRRHRGPRTRLPRVAWVSPLPPVRSGIADYSAELIERLTGLEIEPVVSPGTIVDGPLSRERRILSADQLRQRHAELPFDLFVYHVGNSVHHVYMLDLLYRFSGLTVLHDLRLPGLALHANRAGRWPGDLAVDLREENVEVAAAFVAGQSDHRVLADAVSLNRRIVRASEAVVVHNASGWAAVREGSSMPVFRIPLGIDVPRLEPGLTRETLRLPAGDFVIVSLGEVTASKRIGSLIAAIAALPDRIRNRAALHVVGEVSDAMREELTRDAASAGLSSRVVFAGRVPLEWLPAYARLSDVCVQLRYPHRGETSAALLRALSAGAACIVSDSGSLGEVPDDVCVKVRTPPHDEVSDLTGALVRLHEDRVLGSALRAAAVRHVREHHSLEGAARAYTEAVHLTIASRRARDGEWVDAAAAALASAGAVPADAFDRWAAIRAGARRAGDEERG
jgi:glycosyltransferase involved in cell wall biosynthesis